MPVSKARHDQVIFRLTADEHELLAAYARARGQSPGQAARDLTLAGLRGGPAAPPTSVTLARKTAYSVIVALSPELDEQATEAFLREVFDR
jgi:hypothetical protein